MDSLPANTPALGTPQLLPSLTPTTTAIPHGRLDMSNETRSPETTFGYLSVINSPEHGYFGGYLIVGPLGRPLEFHCTAPVRPSRAQQILYGPTLEPFLLGEQIAGAMLDAAKLKPQLILTNCEATFHIRARLNSPMLLLSAKDDVLARVERSTSDEVSDASTAVRFASATDSGPHESFIVEGFTFLLPIGFESDRDQATHLLNGLVPQIDLAEPFGRIEEAIREAQRLGGGEAHEKVA